jgi:hypothetical protein
MLGYWMNVQGIPRSWCCIGALKPCLRFAFVPGFQEDYCRSDNGDNGKEQ